MSLLRLDDVAFTYPGASRPALDGVSLAVAAGEGVALVGPNGAGKSTLLRLAMALRQPTAGTVRVDGRATAGLQAEDLAATAGYLFQDPGTQLFATTVAEELAFGPRQLGVGEAEIAARRERLLARLGLADAAARHPYDLPLPARRLVALAATLMNGPALLLLDEPTAALDRGARALVERVVREERARGTAVVAITHDAAFAAEACDRALQLAHGRLVADEPLAAWLGRLGEAELPVPAAVARALALPGAPRRGAEVAAALAARWRGGDPAPIFDVTP